MTDFFTQFFYIPLYNALVGLYSFTALDFGLAIVALTVIIKFALLPLSRKQIASQKDLQRIQPQIKEIQQKHKDDRQKAAQETMRLYKENNISLGAGCLPLIFQIIVFFAMYRVIINITNRDEFLVLKDDLYAFVPVVDKLSETSLGILALGAPNAFLAVVTALAQWYQIYMMQQVASKKKAQEPQKEVKKTDGTPEQPDFATIMQKQMLFIIPGMTLFIGLTFPAGLTLYWLTSTIFTVIQQWFVMRQDAPTKES